MTYANNETQRMFETIIAIQPRHKQYSSQITEENVSEKLAGY